MESHFSKRVTGLGHDPSEPQTAVFVGLNIPAVFPFSGKFYKVICRVIGLCDPVWKDKTPGTASGRDERGEVFSQLFRDKSCLNMGITDLNNIHDTFSFQYQTIHRTEKGFIGFFRISAKKKTVIDVPTHKDTRRQYCWQLGLRGNHYQH